MNTVTDAFIRMYNDLIAEDDQTGLERFRREYRAGAEEVLAKLGNDYAITEEWGDPALVCDLGDDYAVEVCAMYPLTHPTECTLTLLWDGSVLDSRTVGIEEAPGVVEFLSRNADTYRGLYLEYETLCRGEVIA